MIAAVVVLSACLNGWPVSAASPKSWTEAISQGDREMEANNPKQAEAAFRLAVRLAKGESKNPFDIDRCLLKLTSALVLLGKIQEANEILQSMLARLDRDYGAESSHAAPVLMALGSIQESAGDHERAMFYYKKALALTEKHYGPYSPLAGGILHGMGRINTRAGNRNEAADNYKRAITILSRNPNLEAAAQLEHLTHDYADFLKNNDDSDRSLLDDFRRSIDLPTGSRSDQTSRDPNVSYSEIQSPGAAKSEANASGTQLRPPMSTSSVKSAWQLQCEQRLDTLRQGQSDENTQVALRGVDLPPDGSGTLKPAFKVLGDTINTQNRYGMGESQYKRMIATDIDSLGPHHPSVANDLTGLAQLYMAQKRHADAQPLLIRALAIYEQAYGADNALTISTRASLAAAEFQLGQIDKAAAHFNDALNAAQAILGPNSLETATILNGLAYLYFYKGDLERSATFYKWAIASTERSVGTTDPLLAACFKDYAQVLRRLGRNSEASSMESQAAEILSNRALSNK